MFADGLSKITDIDVSPDGNLYVLSNYHETPTIFRPYCIVCSTPALICPTS